MKTYFLKLSLFSLLTAIPISVMADEISIPKIESYTGICTIIMGRAPQKCNNNVVVSHLGSGRSTISFFIGKKGFFITGQYSETRRTLVADTFRIIQGNKITDEVSLTDFDCSLPLDRNEKTDRKIICQSILKDDQSRFIFSLRNISLQRSSHL